jgi:AraC-like DNA-binding protein
MHHRLGLSVGYSAAVPACFLEPHQHDEIELNYLGAGHLKHRIGESEWILPSRALAVFWAGFPHHVTEVADARDLYWLHIPLESFLAWRLPQGFRRRLLAGEVVVDRECSRRSLDLALFRSWSKDLAGHSGSGRQWALLELEARLGRLAESAGGPDVANSMRCGGLGSARASSVARLAQFVSEHYTERWRWQEAAQSAGLSPCYARRCFEGAYGMTLHQYVLRLRLARAKQLLATADTKIVDVALESGFPTLSNFYRMFQAETRRTPSAYRKSCAAQSANSG